MSTRGNGRGRGRGTVPVAPAAPILPVDAPAQPIRFHQLCKEYTALGGTKFTGTETIIEAQQWLKQLERIFANLELTDPQKYRLAAWQLQSSAYDWWVAATTQTDEADITWRQFR